MERREESIAGNIDQVLDLLVPARLVALDPERLSFPERFGEEVVDRPEWAYPATEESSQKESRHDYQQRPQQIDVLSAGRQECRQRYQRVDLQENRDRVGEGVR